MSETTKSLTIYQQWENTLLRVTDIIEVEPKVLYCNGSVIGTLGNFSASTGKAKSKKTFNVSALVAATLINGEILQYEANFPKSKCVVLYFDTEQSPYHCHKVISRILRLAGLPSDRHPDNLKFSSLRAFNPQHRLEIIEAAIQQTPNVGLVVIDGIRDCMYDINNATESTNLINKLMELSDVYKIHIHTVLHLNKSDDNVRGHVGTELNNKAETVLQVSRSTSDDAITEVSAPIIRDIEFEPFAFRINDDGLPEIAAEYVFGSSMRKSAPFAYEELTEQQHRDNLEQVFATGAIKGCSNLISKLKLVYGYGDNKTKGLKTFLANKRLIVRENDGYHYNSDARY
jgi:hypothetical protein